VCGRVADGKGVVQKGVPLTPGAKSPEPRAGSRTDDHQAELRYKGDHPGVMWGRHHASCSTLRESVAVSHRGRVAVRGIPQVPDGYDQQECQT
jgi:hypothetical protein